MRYFNKAMLVASAALCFNLSTFAQDISLKINNVTVKEAMEQLKKTSGYSFVFSSNDINTKQRVSVSAEDATIEEVVKQILKGQAGIDYEIQGKKIVLKKKNSSVSQQKSGKVTGRVLDAKGEPIIGATIMEKGTSNGTITDFDGNFMLEVPAGASIEISYIGYQTQLLSADINKLMSVTLKEDTEILEEVVVVGYGTQKKVNITGAVSTVDAKEISTMSVSNLGQALQGRVAGLQINSNSGAPGASSGIVLRGLGSFKAATSPLVLVDGVESSIDLVSPKDVESISVLKDASATSIYGTRAANGVILVTTKKGNINTLDLSLSLDYGVLTPCMEMPTPLNAHDMAMLQNEAAINKGGNALWTEEQISKLGVGTNWLEEGIQNGYRFNPHFSARGGSDKFSFNATLDYLDEKGIVYNSAYKRVMGLVNLNANVSKYLKWGWNTRFVNKIYSYGGASLDNLAKFPSWINVVNPDGTPGSYNLDPNIHPAQARPDFINPLYRSDLDVRNLSNPTYTLISSMFAEINVRDFKFRTTLSGNLYYSFGKSFTPSYVYYDATGKDGNHVIEELTTDRSVLTQEAYHNFEWRIINQLSYEKNIKGHNIGIMLGHDELRAKNQNFSASRRGFSNQDILVLSLGTDNDMARGASSNYAMRSFFGRINYDYIGKYLLELSVRHDGSTAFSPKNRWGTFPGGSIGWRISEENFFPKLSWLDNLKLRLSYGLTGNAPTGFEWLSLLQSGKSYATSGNPNSASGGNLIPGVTLPGNILYSPNIKWEESRTSNIGFDLNMFNNKLNVTAEFYQKKTNDLLFPLQVSSISGVFSGDNAGTQLTNFAAIDNKGIELLVQYRDRFGDFDFSGTFTFSRNVNKITKINQDNESIGTYTIQKVGYPINSLYGYVTDGELYKSEEQIESTPSLSDAKVGSFIYKDISGPEGIPDGVIDQFDRTIIGNPNPGGIYGLNLYLGWKNFDFTFFAQGESGKDFFNVGPDLTGFNNFEAISWNNFDHVLDRYHPVNNPNGTRPSVGLGNNPPSSYHVDNVSYLRVRNIELGYKFPTEILEKVGLKSLRLYANVRNLFTLTSSKSGFDPERGNNAASPYAVFPQPRVINFGVNIMF